MGKGIVRFLNLGYLAACAVSIWAVCTKPIFQTSVNLDMSPEKLGEVLQPLFTTASGSLSGTRAHVTREDTSEKQITDFITVDRIADAFRNEEDPKKNGLHLSVPIAIEAKYAFDLQNQNVINEIVVSNIETILDEACSTLATPLTNFIFSITKEFAIYALETSINAQIKNALGEDSPISTAEVEEIYNNVYEALSSNDGSIPLSSLTDVIINGKDGDGTGALSILNKNKRYVYYECDPQPTEEQYAANPTEFFAYDEANKKYVNTETYDDTKTYFTFNYIESTSKLSKTDYDLDPTKYLVYDKESKTYKNTEAFNSEATYYTRNYEQCPPEFTQEEYEANPTKYFVYDDEQGKYVNTESYDNTATYFTLEYKEGRSKFTKEDYDAEPTKYFVFNSEEGKYKTTETFDSEATYFEREENPYTQEDLDRVDIEGQMEDALNKVPGLVENEFVLAEDVTEEKFNASLKSDTYYVSKDGVYNSSGYGEDIHPQFEKVTVDGVEQYVPSSPTAEQFANSLVSNTYYILVNEEYVAAKTYDANETYYTSQATVKDIDTALVALINQYLLQKGEGDESSGNRIENSRGMRAQLLTNAKSKEELNNALKEFAGKYIPLSQISSVNDGYGKFVPYALLAIIVLVAFPWALLALVTFIRTLRRDKVWTKPWIVIVLAFPQIIFGLLLTYGLKYGLPIAAQSVEIIQKILDVGVTAEISTLCLIPSFVYFGVVIYSFVYIFFAHAAKVEYKLMKRARRRRY